MLRCKMRQRQKLSLAVSHEASKSGIVTTPLDYATFRNEIISKYPTYDPPPLNPVATVEDVGSSSIKHVNPTSNHMDLPVFTEGHWSATPMPSPPPSPKGKKSMYTTDQTIPFVLPLGESVLSTIPQSILEGAQLFQSRQRSSVPLAQLWEEQEHFVRSERGWSQCAPPIRELKSMAPETIEDATLHDVEILYAETLSNLPGFVSTLISLMDNVAAVSTSAGGASLLDKEVDLKIEESVASTHGWLFIDSKGDAETPAEEPSSPGKLASESEAFREIEILLKGITGSLLLLLKWFRVSHILKEEYLSQLLIDADWINTSHQVLIALNPSINVAKSHEDPHRSYFVVCAALSTKKQQTTDTELLPLATAAMSKGASRQRSESNSSEKELPAISKYDWTVFFATINILRITQKLVKKKTHRNHLLVQAKSWLHLRRPLKIPHDYLQLCCLKLYKGQVPLCSRKWRMSNMKVITQIYMSCRPELREDWIAGTEADTDLQEAKQQEEAVRALVRFYNDRNYPSQNVEVSHISVADQDDSETEDFFENEVRRSTLVV